MGSLQSVQRISIALPRDFRKKTVNVMTPGRQLVCTSEHCPVGFETGPHYQVRVAPHTDAGLMLCGLLALDKLEGDSRGR